MIEKRKNPQINTCVFVVKIADNFLPATFIPVLTVIISFCYICVVFWP